MLNIIPLSHFVKVTSTGVSPAFTFNRLNALVMSSPTTPQQPFSEYLGASAVGTAYGLNSKEYSYAQDFFGYVSKSATTPERLSFYAYYPNGSKATIKGASLPPLSELKKEGGFAVDIDGATTNLQISLTSCTSYSEVANVINTALDSKGACVYSNVTKGLIIEVANIGEAHTISFAKAILKTPDEIAQDIIDEALEQAQGQEAGADGEVTVEMPVEVNQTNDDILDLSSLLGLTASSGAIIINGRNATTLNEALNEISVNNGNYVSVATLESLEPATDFEVISNWTNASAGRYCFIANDDTKALTTAEEQYKELKGNDGFILNYSSDKKINALTQAIIGSVDFSAVNGAINVNFIEADNLIDMAIDNAETLGNLNNQKCNFAYNVGGYGQSQVLYGEGAIFGSVFSDISGFIGNTWLKAQLEIYGMNAFISLPLISLRGAGRNILLSALQEPINMAKRGGIIVSVGQGNLTTTEKNVIITATGSADTPNLIEQNGYYLMSQPLTDDDIAKKQVRLLLIYTRNIPINRVVVQNYVLGA